MKQYVGLVLMVLCTAVCLAAAAIAWVFAEVSALADRAAEQVEGWANE